MSERGKIHHRFDEVEVDYISCNDNTLNVSLSNTKMCPFCEDIKQVTESSPNDKWKTITCCKCGAQGASGSDVNNAVINWNTRPIEDAMQTKLDIAVAALIKARTEVVQYYPPHEYTLEIIDEALKKLEIT